MPKDDPGGIAAAIAEIVVAHESMEGPMLPILHAVQERFGYIPEQAAPVIATALNLGRAEVHGVITFYHDYRSQPAGRHVLKLCRAEACQAVGADQLAADIQKLLGIGWHETTPDGRVTLEPVFCLGLCACGPAAMVDGRLKGRADASLVEEVRA